MSVPNIHSIAVIGAGLGGVVAAAHLRRAGLAVTVFERGDRVGGVWLYSEQPAAEPPFPNPRPEPAPPPGSGAALEGGEVSLAAAARAFAPPGPTFTNMRSRGSEATMRTTLRDWPAGTRAPIPHADVVAYIEGIADAHGVRDAIRFRTRVDAVSSQAGGDRGRWCVQTSRLVPTATPVGARGRVEREPAQYFDAVVVATGRYNAPRVPDVPGLARWKARFPGRIRHTKQYRTAEPYRGKTVLLIGASISALEVANELVADGGAAKVYLSARPSGIDCRGAVKGDDAGAKTERVAMVAEFGAPDASGPGDNTSAPLPDDSPIPAGVVLQDGRALDGIHHVVFGTGYLHSYPFLGPALEQPRTAPRDADGAVVTTADARAVHNLHEDLFYIPDPTLAFAGVTHFASEFSMQDVQAQVLAAVWAGRVRLPPPAAMRAEQARRKCHLWPDAAAPAPQGPPRALNAVYLLDDLVIRRLLDWVNPQLAAAGFEPLAGPDPAWWTAFRAESEHARSAMGQLQDQYLRSYGLSWADLPSLVPYTGK